MPYSEVEKDLIFLKPILEGCGIEFNKKELEKQFSKVQSDYIENKELFSHKALVKELMKGSEFYPSLKGLENVEEQIKNKEIAESMARQIEEEICYQKTDLHSQMKKNIK